MEFLYEVEAIPGVNKTKITSNSIPKFELAVLQSILPDLFLILCTQQQEHRILALSCSNFVPQIPYWMVESSLLIVNFYSSHLSDLVC